MTKKINAWLKAQNNHVVFRMPFSGVKITRLDAIAILVISVLGAAVLTMLESLVKGQ